MAGKHRAPTNTKRNVQRAATAGVVSLAALGFARPAAATPVEASQQVVPAPRAVPILPKAAPVLEAAPERPQLYTVQPGDWLSAIARDSTDLCGGGADPATCWQPLYEQNLDVIGADPDLIFPGQVLHFVGGTLLPNPPQAAAAEAPVTDHAPISNSAGPVQQHTQAAADAVFTNVPGAQLITYGGTRASAIDPHGHPSGNAIDYMVMADLALGDAIVAYNVAHWDELGVEYIIWQQRILTSRTGSWQFMEDRGSPTQNHRDHVHANYR